MNQRMIAKARNGDLEAFTAFVKEYSSFLMAVVLPILRNPSTAEDVLQETYIQVYRSLSDYNGGSFKHWVARIATNKALDWKRREKRRQGEELTESIKQCADRLNAGAATESEVVNNETANDLKRALQQLPPDYRQTLVGFYLDDKSYQTLAQEAGVAVRTVESRGRRQRYDSFQQGEMAALQGRQASPVRKKRYGATSAGL